MVYPSALLFLHYERGGLPVQWVSNNSLHAVCSLYLYQLSYVGLVPFSDSHCQSQNLDRVVTTQINYINIKQQLEDGKICAASFPCYIPFFQKPQNNFCKATYNNLSWWDALFDIKSVQASETWCIGKTQRFKWLFHPWLWLLLPSAPSHQLYYNVM